MQSITVKAPGRINLIGEHTDYNNGYVLPAAIQKAATVTIEKRTDNLVVLTALDLHESITITIADIKPSATQWVNYIIGVIAQFQKIKRFPSGFSVTLKSDIPIGAGLSSSAAIECAVAYALNELFAFGIDKMELALMAQKAEHEYAGVQCGIMDQFASLFGKKDQVVLLDCKTMKYQYFPFDLNEYSIVLFDTQIKHALASSEYNTRRLECEAGVAMIREKYKEVATLREASLTILNECVNENLYPIIYNRCKYVIQEIERTVAATKNLAAKELKAFGAKMFVTHEGLSKLYEVSCPELDLLVDMVKNKEQVLGARMMGGGFGGCTINIIKTNAVNDLIASVSETYKQQTGKDLQHYMVSIEDGANVITNSKF